MNRRNILFGFLGTLIAPWVPLSAKAAKSIPTMWETGDGSLIPIKAMSTSHIVNCIRFIKRSERMKGYEDFHARCVRYVPVFKAELNRRWSQS